MEQNRYSSDVAFTDTVKAIQRSKGSRRAYERMEEGGSWESAITPELRAFVEAQRSFFMATANRDGQPYIQHRGGPPGFLRVLDDRTLGFADYAGNRQYITLGNLAENPKATILAIDHAQRQRVKIWGEASLVEDDRDLLDSLMPEGSAVYLTRAIRFRVLAWDINCPSHIPQLFTLEEVEAASTAMLARIAELEAQMAERG